MQTAWARRCVACGVAALAATGVIALFNPTVSCGGLARSIPPIIGFEFATDAEDLAAVFGPAGACRDAMIAGFRTGNLVDYAFMLAYGAFLFCAMRARGARVGALLAIAAPCADALENIALLAIDPGSPDPWIPLLMIASRAKFALLAAWAVAFAIELAREAGWLRWLAIVEAAAGLAIGLGLVAPGILVPATTASWVAALVWAGVRSAR